MSSMDSEVIKELILSIISTNKNILVTV